MVAAAALEGNLEDSDRAAEEFSILNAGMWGRAGQREQASGNLKHWEAKYTKGTLVRRRDGGGLSFGRSWCEGGKANLLH